MERLYEFGWNIGTAIVTAIGAGVLWLIRRVLTNQTEIALLRQHIEARDKVRDEDRQATAEIRNSVNRIEAWIMGKAK